jgi:CBS domain-containing protein
MLVSHLLSDKGRAIVSVSPDASVYSAISLMAEKSIGAVLVIEHGKLVGVLSERDYARKVILQDRSSKTTAVREIMTSKVITGRPNQTVHDCMTLMTDKRIRHLPITDGERLLGIISIGDLVKAIIADQEFTIRQLETYIAS